MTGGPGWDAQAVEEVEEVLGSRAQPDMQDYGKLRYVTRCVCESMRLYPHPPVLLRRAAIPDTLPGAHPWGLPPARCPADI